MARQVAVPPPSEQNAGYTIQLPKLAVPGGLAFFVYVGLGLSLGFVLFQFALPPWAFAIRNAAEPLRVLVMNDGPLPPGPNPGPGPGPEPNPYPNLANQIATEARKINRRDEALSLANAIDQFLASHQPSEYADAAGVFGGCKSAFTSAIPMTSMLAWRPFSKAVSEIAVQLNLQTAADAFAALREVSKGLRSS